MCQSDNQCFLSGRGTFFSFGVIFILAGMGAIVSGSMAMSSSGAYSIGGVYSGIISFLFGLTLAVRPQIYDGYCNHVVLVLVTIANFAAAIVAVALSAATSKFIKNLEACADYSSSLTTSCGFNIHAECTGDSAYYFSAAVCLSSGGSSAQDGTCYCVESDGDCWEINGVDNCSGFLNDTPKDLDVAVGFFSIILIVSFIEIIFLIINRCCPLTIRSDAEKLQLEESGPMAQQATPPTVVAPPAGVVIASSAVPAGTIIAEPNKV